MSPFKLFYLLAFLIIQLECGFGYKCDAIAASSCTKGLNSVQLLHSKFTDPRKIEEKCR